MTKLIFTKQLHVKVAVRSYLLDESRVATWMVSNVHMTKTNGMKTWKNRKERTFYEVQRSKIPQESRLQITIDRYIIQQDETDRRVAKLRPSLDM